MKNIHNSSLCYSFGPSLVAEDKTEVMICLQGVSPTLNFTFTAPCGPEMVDDYVSSINAHMLELVERYLRDGLEKIRADYATLSN